MKPRLVVMSGYPGCGKTTVAGYMQRELGFTRVGSDDYRDMLFGKNFVELLDDPDFNEKEYGLVWPLLNNTKLHLLGRGKDVVVDCTASYNAVRNYLFDTSHGDFRLPAEKYLLLLRVDKEVLAGRDHPDAIEIWDEVWQEPDMLSGYEIIERPNNTQEDLEETFEHLREKFRKRQLIWLPY